MLIYVSTSMFCLRWYMPVNTTLTFLFGGVLGWIAVKLLKPEAHLEGLIVAMCSTGIAVASHLFMYLPKAGYIFMQHLFSFVMFRAYVL